MSAPAPDPETPAQRRRDDLAADRLVYFSDAVVAIAITLLVLPLVDLVPEARFHRESVHDLIAHNTGPIFAFLLSFAVISRLWSSHHGVFDGVQRVGRGVIVVDMIWLLTIVVLPFPTALTGTTSDDPLTVQLYVGVLAVNLVAMTVLAVLIHRQATGDGVRTAEAARGVGSSAVVVVLGFVLVLILPALGFWVLLLLVAGPLVERVVIAVSRRRSG